MLELRYPNAQDEAVLRLAHEELALDGSNFLLDAYQPTDQFSDYLARVQNSASGANLMEGRVRADYFVAVVDGVVVGRSSIRHELNDWLATYGGHIGYAVRPGFRRQGFATEILRQSLIYAKGLGLARVLLTCFDENIGSRTVIESQGGILQDKVEEDGLLTRRYWIDLSVL